MLSRIVPFFLLAAAGLAQDAARMEQIVQSYVDARQFMGTALVARGSQVVFSKGFGSANLEWNVPNAPDTKFRLGSITKQFTAACILLLEERGKLTLADPVKKHMPDAPAAWDKVTLHHLLTHTSGIPSFTGFPEYAKLKPYPATPAELVARFRDKPLEFEPGARWNYSNSGYLLLGYLVEKISGRKYAEFVQENIFNRLDMKDSGYDSNAAVIPRRADGYVSKEGRFEHAGYIDMTIPHGAGALYSTTEDLLKWQRGLFGGKVLQAASLAKMTTPSLEHYALGLSVRTEAGHKVIEHGGGIDGFNTQLAYYPDEQLTVAVLSNVNGGAPSEIERKLAAVARGEKVVLTSERKEIPLDAAIVSRYLGAYGLERAGTLLIALDGKQLTSRLSGQPAFPIFAESETRFFLKAVDAQLEFSKVDGGRAVEVKLFQGGRTIAGKRLDEAEAKRLADAAAATARRFREQQPAAGGEAALRKLIDGIRAGAPDYGAMSTGLAEATRRQLPQLQATLRQLGDVQSVAFQSVAQSGQDVYLVRFENGALEYRIWVSTGGKVESASMRPAQ